MTAAAALPRFRPSSGAGIPECFIANAAPGQKVVVAVHGISRNAAEIAMRFAAHPAFAKTTIIAPLFSKEGFGQYQQLQIRKPGQTAADAGLIRLLDALAPDLGDAAARFALFGFSGGAQMAHRFAMFHPERITRLCVVSAGWYCLPRTDLPWPYGIGASEGEVIEGGTATALVGPDFLDIPTTVIVGNRDTRVDASVRQDALITEHQGRNRLRRARCYVRAAGAYADSFGKSARPQLLTLHGMSHDFTQCVTEGSLVEIAAQNLL